MRPEYAAVITCDPDRLAMFEKRWARVGMPLPLYVVHSVLMPDPRIGCWQGHLAALKGGRMPVLVFEDDADFLPSFSPDVDWPIDCDIGHYGCTLGAIPVVTPGPIQRVYTAYRTHAYIATDPRNLAYRLGPPTGGHLTDSYGWRASVRYALRSATVVQS